MPQDLKNSRGRPPRPPKWEGNTPHPPALAHSCVCRLLGIFFHLFIILTTTLCCFSISTFSNSELDQSAYSNVVFQFSLSLITLPYLYICYSELEQSVYSNVVFQFSLSLITLPYLYIVILNLRNLFILTLFFNSHFL